MQTARDDNMIVQIRGNALGKSGRNGDEQTQIHRRWARESTIDQTNAEHIWDVGVSSTENAGKLSFMLVQKLGWVARYAFFAWFAWMAETPCPGRLLAKKWALSREIIHCIRTQSPWRHANNVNTAREDRKGSASIKFKPDTLFPNHTTPSRGRGDSCYYPHMRAS